MGLLKKKEVEVDAQELVGASFDLENNSNKENNVIYEYTKPNVKTALLYRDRHHPHDHDGKPLGLFTTKTGSYFSCHDCCSKKSEGEMLVEEDNHPVDMIRFGPGISSYFKWLKLLFIMYCCLLLVQFPAILFNVYSGDYYDGMAFPIAKTTIGNLYEIPSNVTELEFSQSIGNNSTNNNNTNTSSFTGSATAVSKGGNETHYEFRFSCDEECLMIEKQTMVFYFGCLDAFTTLIFLGFICCAQRCAKLEQRRFRKRILKLEHYSVQVGNIPKDCNPEQLKHHFERLVNGEIHDVQVVQTTGNTIKLCIHRGKLIKQLARRDAQLKYYQQVNASKSLIAKTKKKYQEIYEKILELDKETSANNESSSSGDGLFAFVTFERQADREKCLKLYGMFQCSLTQNSILRLNQERTLKVTAAPPPSTLIWENNDVTKFSRFIRSLITGIIMVLLICLTVGINFSSDPYKLSKTVYDLGTNSGNPDLMCDGAFKGLTFQDSLNKSLTTESDLVLSQGSTLLDCLCESELTTLGKATFATESPSNNETTVLRGIALFQSGQPCDTYISRRTKALWLQVGVSFGTLVVNSIIFFVLAESGFFIKFTSIVQQEMTLLKRMFSTTFINTGLVVILVNADLPALFGVKFVGVTEKVLGSGSFVDFSQEWFRAVGTEIMLVTLLNVFAPHMYPLLIALIKRVKRAITKPISQQQLNEMYLGPEFLLSYRYSQALMMGFLIMMTSSGMPILYVFGIASVGLTYWVDKFFFVKLCRIPPQFSGEQGIWANDTFQWAAAIHLLVGIWMFSNPFIFPETGQQSQLGIMETLTGAAGVSQETLENYDFSNGLFYDFGLEMQRRFSRESSIPNLFVLIIFISFRILMKFRFFVVLIEKVISSFANLIETLCFKNAFTSLLHHEDEDDHITLQDSIDIGELRGINSYNILANPKYARAFRLHEHTKKNASLMEILTQKATVVGFLSSSQSSSVDGEF